MKRRSFFLLLAAIAGGLLLLGGEGAYAILTSGPFSLIRGGVQTQPAAAFLVAKQAPVMVSLLVNPDRLERATQVAVPADQRRQVRSAFRLFQQRLLASSGFDGDYARDLQPWLGEEISLAVTTPDLDYDASTGLQPGYLAVLATRHPDQSRAWLQRFWQRQAGAGAELVFEDYKGVTLIYSDVTTHGTAAGEGRPVSQTALPFQRDFMHTLATAVVGDRWVVLANSPKVLREAINNLQVPDLNLASSPAYQASLEGLERPRIGFAYVNFGQFQAWQRAARSPMTGKALVAGSGATASGAMAPEEPRYGSLALNLGLTQQGFRLDTALLPAPGQTLPSTSAPLTAPVAALQYVPASSALVIAGVDLQQFWQQLQTDLQGYPQAEQGMTQWVQNFRERYGVDLPTDIFSWVQEDYAIGVLPTVAPSAPFSASGLLPRTDGLFIARRSAQTEAAIAHLDEVAQSRGFSTGPFPLGEQQVYAWTRLTTTTKPRPFRRGGDKPEIKADVLGVHTTVEDYEIFATSLEAMSAALAAASTRADRSSPLTDAIVRTNTPNDGFVYLNWHEGRSAIVQTLPLFRLLEFAAKPLCDRLDTFIFSSYGSNHGIKRGTAFFRLGVNSEF
ncbi:DUF3352 domain-containing protein [Trichothermofontia sp.]